MTETTESSEQLIDVSKKRFKSSQVFSLAATILLSLTITLFCVGFLVRYEVDSEVSSISSISYWKDPLPPQQQIWYDEAVAELQTALHRNWQQQRARNVILFVTSGIEMEALAAARSLHNNTMPQQALSWERFPHLGRLKNSCSLTDICDPFTVATSFFSGARPKFRVGGLDSSVPYGDCVAALNDSAQLQSVLLQAQQNGLRTGFVTNRRVTGPGMAALYAHTANTAWECDASMPLAAVAAGCQDVAQQLLSSAAGRALNVILGGGRQTLVSHVPVTDSDPIDETVCNSQDGRHILRDWRKQHMRQQHSYAVLQNNYELETFNGSTVDYVMGIFANGALYPQAKQKTMPQLDVMVNKSLAVLKRKDRGYFLVVESGVKSGAGVEAQVEVLLQLNALVEQISKSSSAEETLQLVIFTNGNYVRTTFDMSAEVDVAPNNIDFADLDENGDLDEHLVHMPADSLAYAKGPRAYLLHGVHEETYLSYVISYALAMGHFNPNSNDALKNKKTR